MLIPGRRPLVAGAALAAGITHHQGAVTMATDVLTQGRNVQIGEMATDLIAQQTRQVEQMREL